MTTSDDRLTPDLGPPPWEAELPEHYRGGVPGAVGVHLAELSAAGTSVDLPASGVIAVVGANNAGKSTLLREIVTHLGLDGGAGAGPCLVLEGVRLQATGSGPDVISWVGQHLPYSRQIGVSGFATSRGVLAATAIADQWTHRLGPDRLGLFSDLMVLYVMGEGRTAGVSPQPQRSSIGEPPAHPLHRLQDSPVLLAELDALARRVLRTPLTLDRLSGQVQLRLGRTAVPAPPVDAVTAQYRDALAGLPALHEQGDGMRSLLSMLLPLVTASHSIVVIDEPEAFLHPPQAAALGRVLGELTRKRRLQVVLATHDRNLLAGLLGSGADTAVLRLDRTPQGTQLHSLPADRLRVLWENPVTRYSNVLDGLFYRLVVLAESDADCRFYAAALDAYDQQATASGRPLKVASTDVLFVPAGGKAGLPALLQTLQAVSVPVVATADLDVLNEEGLLRRIVEALGGRWQDIEATYRTSVAPLRAPGTAPSARQVLAAITDLLAPAGAKPVSGQLRDDVLTQLRVGDSPWKAVKTSGMTAFTGDSGAAVAVLVDRLDSLGLVAVRAGELERLAPRVAVTKGAAWLPAALAARAHEDQPAQDHVRRLLAAGGLA